MKQTVFYTLNLLFITFFAHAESPTQDTTTSLQVANKARAAILDQATYLYNECDTQVFMEFLLICIANNMGPDNAKLILTERNSQKFLVERVIEFCSRRSQFPHLTNNYQALADKAKITLAPLEKNYYQALKALSSTEQDAHHEQTVQELKTLHIKHIEEPLIAALIARTKILRWFGIGL